MTPPAYTLASAPGALPLLGHTLALVRRPLELVASLPAHGDLVRIRMGPHRAYVVCHPDLVHRVLTEDRTFDKGGPFYDKFREAAGDGISSCPASAHRRQRRLVQPAFHHTRLPGYAATMTREIAALTRHWHHGQVLDVPTEMSRLSAAVTAGCLFTLDSTALPGVFDSVTAISTSVARRVMLALPMADRIPTPANRRFARARAHLRELTEVLIADRRATGVHQDDLLSTLLTARDQDGRGLTDTEIHDQLVTFVIAGVETTACTLSWAWHLLGTRPDIRARVQAEADAALGGRTARYEDLPALGLTRRVVAETLRLYPPGWLITRRTTADTELGGHHLPTGTTVVYSSYQLHHRADLHPDPESFEPDRPHRGPKPAHGSLVPFGRGARKCLGETFALTETVLALASIAAHWQLRPVPGPRVRPSRRATLGPHRLTMRLHRRHATGALAG
ncbi:cytochrome P450 [Kitasatospora sp. NPDC088548]|uniref:cytochrome P450 n=1 Tax=Kitasatospora sp. NPDC088548 TaxID=3364075 RepID=UPI0038176352